MSPSTAYLFLELAILIYLLGFCGEQLYLREYKRSLFWTAVALLGVFWFIIDKGGGATSVASILDVVTRKRLAHARRAAGQCARAASRDR